MLSIVFILIIILMLILAFYKLNLKSKNGDNEESLGFVPDDIDVKPLQINPPAKTWTQYKLSITHDGRAHIDSSINGNITRTWKTQDINLKYYGASKSSPAIDKNLIFIGADTGILYAFNRSMGEEVWNFSTRPSENGIHSSPAIDKEKVYVGTYDGWLYALYKTNGTLAWETQLGDYIGSSPCIYEGVIYIGVEMSGPAGYLVGCNITSGSEVFRSVKFGDHPHSTPSIDPDREYIYIGSNDHRIYCYDLNTKKQVWNYKTGGDIKSTPCISKDVLYITSWDNKMYCFNLSTGTRYFSFKTADKTMSSPAINSDGDKVYFGSHDGYIYCINARNGSEIWKFKTNEIILSSPILVEKNNYLVCGSNDRKVYILNAVTGKEVITLNIKSGVSSVPVIVQNQLYIFDNEGRLHRFDAN
jgi:outer membrane protein assembly factor BamB